MNPENRTIFGRNIRPGFTPGGFWPPLPQQYSTWVDPQRLPPKPGGDHREIREACNRILDGRNRRPDAALL